MERTGIKKQDPNHLGFGRLLAWKSSDVSQGWVSILMLNFLSMYFLFRNDRIYAKSQ